MRAEQRQQSSSGGSTRSAASTQRQHRPGSPAHLCSGASAERGGKGGSAMSASLLACVETFAETAPLPRLAPPLPTVPLPPMMNPLTHVARAPVRVARVGGVEVEVAVSNERRGRMRVKISRGRRRQLLDSALPQPRLLPPLQQSSGTHSHRYWLTMTRMAMARPVCVQRQDRVGVESARKWQRREQNIGRRQAVPVDRRHRWLAPRAAAAAVPPACWALSGAVAAVEGAGPAGTPGRRDAC